MNLCSHLIGKQNELLLLYVKFYFHSTLKYDNYWLVNRLLLVLAMQAVDQLDIYVFMLRCLADLIPCTSDPQKQKSL